MSTNYHKYNAIKDQAEFNKKMRKFIAERECLKCGKEFTSKSKENRLCKKCKEKNNEFYQFEES